MKKWAVSVKDIPFEQHHPLVQIAEKHKKRLKMPAMSIDELLKLPGPFISTLKMDGEHNIMVWKRGDTDCTLVNSYGTFRSEMPVSRELAKLLNETTRTQVILAGELYAVRPDGSRMLLREVSHFIKAPTPQEESQVRIALFDVIEIDGQPATNSYDVKLDWMNKILTKDSKTIKVVDYEIGGAEIVKATWDKWIVKGKMEGLVVHTPGGMIKVKDLSTMDMVIVGLSTKGARFPKGLAGSLLPAFMLPNGLFVIGSSVNVAVVKEEKEWFDWVMAHKKNELIIENEKFVMCEPKRIMEIAAEAWYPYETPKKVGLKYENGEWTKLGLYPAVMGQKPRFIPGEDGKSLERIDKNVNPDDLRLTQCPDFEEEWLIPYGLKPKEEAPAPAIPAPAPILPIAQVKLIPLVCPECQWSYVLKPDGSFMLFDSDKKFHSVHPSSEIGAELVRAGKCPVHSLVLLPVGAVPQKVQKVLPQVPLVPLVPQVPRVISIKDKDAWNEAVVKSCKTGRPITDFVTIDPKEVEEWNKKVAKGIEANPRKADIRPIGLDDKTGIVRVPEVGDKVVRGVDWKWGEQDEDDAGKRLIGTIVSIYGWDKEGDGDYRWVAVRWSPSNSNSYRVGALEDGLKRYDLYYAPEDNPKVKPLDDYGLMFGHTKDECWASLDAQYQGVKLYCSICGREFGEHFTSMRNRDKNVYCTLEEQDDFPNPPKVRDIADRLPAKIFAWGNWRQAVAWLKLPASAPTDFVAYCGRMGVLKEDLSKWNLTPYGRKVLDAIQMLGDLDEYLDEKENEYVRKFGKGKTRFSIADFSIKCKVCGKRYGQHLGAVCPIDDEEIDNPKRVDLFEIGMGKGEAPCPVCLSPQHWKESDWWCSNPWCIRFEMPYMKLLFKKKDIMGDYIALHGLVPLSEYILPGIEKIVPRNELWIRFDYLNKNKAEKLKQVLWHESEELRLIVEEGYEYKIAHALVREWEIEKFGNKLAKANPRKADIRWLEASLDYKSKFELQFGMTKDECFASLEGGEQPLCKKCGKHFGEHYGTFCTLAEYKKVDKMWQDYKKKNPQDNPNVKEIDRFELLFGESEQELEETVGEAVQLICAECGKTYGAHYDIGEGTIFCTADEMNQARKKKQNPSTGLNNSGGI